MKRYISLFPFAIILLSVLSCCDGRDSRLREIDAIIESDPEQAFAELQQFPTAGMPPADSAYYALLYTQAQIKCNIPVASDSLFQVAYSEFKHSASNDLRRRAYFYNAQIAYNADRFRDSMQDAIVAYDMAKEENNPYWIAKAAELIGDILFYAYNYEQAEFFKAEAAENYFKANKIRNHRFALSDLATQYLNEGKEREAVTLFDSLRNVINNEEPFDSVLNHFIMLGLCSIWMDNNQHEMLKQSLPQDADSAHSYISSVDVSILKSYVMTEDGDSAAADRLLAETYAQTSDEMEKIRVMYASYLQLKQTNRPWQALELADSMLYMQSRIGETLVKESVIGVQRDYYSSKSEYQAHNVRRMRRIMVISILTAILIIMLLTIIYRLTNRARKAELETHIMAISQLRDQTNRLICDNNRLSAELSDLGVRLFRDKWAALNVLCDEYFKMGDSERSQALVLNNIKKELEKLRSTKNLKEIEAAVNTYMGGIMTQLRQECSFMKEEDFTFISLIYAGMSVRTICLLMDIKYKLFYLKKSRLSKRILASDAPHRQLFVDKMK